MKFFRKLLLLSLTFLLFGCEAKENQVCFQENCFWVEYAKTLAEQERGLMFRESLEWDHGMIFVFENEKIRSFWMKNTKIPLDIIFLNEGKKVINVAENVPPCLKDPCEIYSSASKTKYVLEINGGISAGMGLKAGDELDF